MPAPVVADAVVRGLSDPDWRPAETCLKVAARHELAGAAAPAVLLLGHPLPRVRAQAARCLGAVGDTEHVAAVAAALDDGQASVRRPAAAAVARLARRLDRPDLERLLD